MGNDLEVAHNQIRINGEEIKRLRNTLGTLIIWLRLDLGDDNVKKLLELMDRE